MKPNLGHTTNSFEVQQRSKEEGGKKPRRRSAMAVSMPVLVNPRSNVAGVNDPGASSLASRRRATDAAVDARTMNYFSRSPVRLHVNWSEKKWRSPSLPRFDTRGRIIRVVRSGRLRQIPDNIGYGS
ncbi:hypothetical protein GWI33_023194 [Rhynchophorus ferrugineus]|uniref:Uncharacterized protein n=1 Tax=Rhynchophorus ferrugineus TaxID=354439 RepID=A0A834INE8_RHYFE|nr:hypothetical protein GWI33_023194 [Rhynchophorus ferrugineus]